MASTKQGKTCNTWALFSGMGAFFTMQKGEGMVQPHGVPLRYGWRNLIRLIYYAGRGWNVAPTAAVTEGAHLRHLAGARRLIK